MKFGVPWSVKGIRPEARETAREAARRSGMSLGDWLNSVIIQQAEQEGVAPELDDEDADDGNMAEVNERLDTLTRRIEQLSRTGPAAYAPKRVRNNSDQLTDLIGRLDKRLELFANMPRLAPMAPSMMPPAAMPQPVPNVRLPPSLDRAVAEIAARKQALNGNVMGNVMPAPQQPRMAAPFPAAAAAPAPALAPMAMPAVVAAPAPVILPAQDLSGLEDQLRNITDQIETLRKPGVEQAINALREELGEIGRTLNDAMPRRAIDAIDKQIKGLTQRIAEGRQAGVDAGALGGLEHGLAEVRDALRGLTPAENLVGFNDAVAGLAHKIDMIVAQKDPATLQQLESAITTLRDMAAHVASNETVHGLAAQVHALGEKIEYIAATGNGGDALNHLDQRISALAEALAERAQSGSAVPPRLEALVQSLSDKIEQIQSSREGGDAFGHLEDRIVKLVEKLDASDSRIGHLESIERGLADFLVHMEEMRANTVAGGLRANGSPGVDDLRQNIARTQDALEAVHGTLGHVVDRLAMIENNMRGEARPRAAAAADEAPLAQPPGKIGVRFVEDAPPSAPAMPAVPVMPAVPAAPPPRAADPAPRRLPPATQLPIDPDLPADQPLEPGSGPPQLRANPAARIAASEAALGGARPADATGGKSSFIAAARRAAQAAGQEPAAPPPRAASAEEFDSDAPSLRTKMMKRVKSLFIASCIIAAVIGSIQIAGTMFDFGKPAIKTVEAPAASTGKTATAVQGTAPSPAPRIATQAPAISVLPGMTPLGVPTGITAASNTLPPGLNQTGLGLPSLLAPPLLGQNSDITGSIPRPAIKSAATQPAAQADTQSADRLPSAIGGIHLRSAAVAGDPAAAFEIAARYAEGRGVPANAEEAARWYERAASKGVAPAEFRYASMLEKGQGVKKDLATARRYYLAAAAKGNGKAMHNVAVLFAEGIDGKPDYASAVQWFRKAAQRGIPDSQYNLGVLCARGLGTAKSYPEAYKWFALAAAQGDQESAKKRDDVAGHMDAAGLAAAHQTVKNFVAEPQPREANMVPEPPGGWDHAASAPAHAKPAPGTPLSLGSFKVGNR